MKTKKVQGTILKFKSTIGCITKEGMKMKTTMHKKVCENT
jgi:hypothetical protein